MDLPTNRFKQALRDGRSQIGLWCTLPGSYAAEAMALAGFDWMLLDTEHSPAEVTDVLHQLQAVAPYPVAPVVRPSANDAVLIKRHLDQGAQTLLVPFVQSAAEARAAADAVRYPPAGIRGVAGFTRATRYGQVRDYATRAGEEICLLVQVETAATLEHIEEIAAVDGVDGLFIGPNDLAASMGRPGGAGSPEVVAAIEDAIRRILAAGKPAGILTPDRDFARHCIELGTTFTAVGVDGGLLMNAARALAAEFRG